MMDATLFVKRVGCRQKGEAGFTLVELVAVMVVIGIMAAVAIPRFVGRAPFEARGYVDQTLVALQYARQQAVAQRRQVCVAVAAGGALAITRAPAPPPGGVCDGTALTDPSTGGAYVVAPPNGVAVAGINGTALPLALNFNPLGQPNTAAALRVTGEDNHCLGIDAVTGYVRPIACP